ncbi:MAG: hypothetical protein PHV30_08025 [Candidatus Margulisbacteria bacterium]|nr:hypothetical protein [Candidatus Margulisiibacteriota bacterium]
MKQVLASSMLLAALLLSINSYIFFENLNTIHINNSRNDKKSKNNPVIEEHLSDWDLQTDGQYSCENFSQHQLDNLLAFLRRSNNQRIISLKIDPKKALAVFQAVNNHE